MTRDESQLLDEISLREASLLDARRELDSGDLGADAFGAIEQRDQTALALARAQLQALRDETRDQPLSARRVRRRRLLALALTCFALALSVLLWSALSPRQAGNSSTGSITLDHAQQIRQLLIEAQSDIAQGNPVTALSAYQQVLALDANNVTALTQTGWLDFSAGSTSKNVTLVREGVATLRRAITLAPRDPGTRLYYAIVAYSTPGNHALAVAQFRIFKTLQPSPAQRIIAQPYLRRLSLS